MPEHEVPASDKLNVEFARRIAEQGASPLNVVVETDFGAAEQVANVLPQIQGVQLGSSGVISPEFVAATLPSSALPAVADLDSVVKIHQDQLVGIKQETPPLPELPFLRPETRPIRQGVSNLAFDIAKVEDKYVGAVGISRVELPQLNFAQLPPGNPIQAAASITDDKLDLGITGTDYIATGESVDWILDGTATSGFDGKNAPVAVIDTGHTPIPPANGGRTPHLESMVPGEAPLDLLGHGTWCTYTAVGKRSPSTYGDCQGVATGADYAHFKALNSFPGFGRTSWIMEAMQRAYDWGADVISMSLGGAQQGPLDEDPYCRFIRRRCKENAGVDEGAIFVVAAGNSGPERWQIGSPGVSEKALTVGAWSMKDESPSFYSSRGPQGDWYSDNPEQFERDKGKYGAAEFVKPDVTAPGGGRETVSKNDEEGELLTQVSTGWMEGLYDGLKDTRGLMKGTSMSCPHVAGLVSRLYDAGVIETAAEVKRIARENSEAEGYPGAAQGANDDVDGKNITVGFGPIRESHFSV